MWFTVEKLEQRVGELQPFRYRDERTIAEWRWKEDKEGGIGTYPSEAGAWQTVRLGHRWQGRDQYVWLAADVDVPQEWQGKKVLGCFDFGCTGSGTNSGFESLLFLNGKPYQGVDTNHQEVFLPGAACGTRLQLRFRLWSGLGGYDFKAVNEHKLALAKLCWLDEAADDLYYTGRAVIETVRQLAESRPERQELLSAMDRAFRLIDWSRPGSGPFYASVAAAREALRAELSRLPKRHPVTVRCIGHTHIDVAWLWRLKHTREKAARSFATVLRLMEQYPEYVFLQTQPQLYDYIKHDYPELYAEIKRRVADGRWEAGGAMWLEADCNLTSGESLVRQLLYGIRFFQKEFGVECKYLWLPDVFGYSWALPQILRLCGIEAFMTTKISWNQYNRMPHDTFYWRGIDGTELLTHFITTPDPGHSEGSFYYTYNGVIMPKTVQGIWDGYRDKDWNRELLLAYGYGDGGGGVNREMLEMRRRVAELPGLPQVTTGRADEYFAGLKRRAEATDRYIHRWDGELYLELHRGTYTSQAYNKRMNRKLELLYREAEWLQAAASAFRGDWSGYAKDELHEGWKIILRNQFHDIIPGSSIREVYEDSRVEYAEAERIGRAAAERALRALTGGNAASGGAPADGSRWYGVLNSASWTRAEPVCVPAPAGSGEALAAGAWLDASGRPLNAQRTADGWFVEIPAVPPLGMTAIRFEPGASAAASAASPFALDADGRGIRTPHYEIRWNESGQLVRLYDRAAGREVLAEGEAGNVLQVFEDKPKSRHEAWDIDIFYMEKMRTIDRLDSAAVVENGPVRAVVEFRWSYMDSSVRQRMIVYARSRRIDFATAIDWHEQRQLLKVAFPVAVRATEATYDIQFGNVKRPTHWNTSWDYAKFETVGHQWADLSERGYGVSLLNDCKYGYDIKDHTLRLTLIKAALVPDDTADQGEHLFTYALLPHEGDWFAGGTVREAWSLNAPLAASALAAESPAWSLFELTEAADHVMIDAVKKAEDSDCLVLRLHEFGGKRGTVELRCGLKAVSWQACDLLERPLGEELRAPEPLVRFAIKPYEIKTFLVRLG